MHLGKGDIDRAEESQQMTRKERSAQEIVVLAEFQTTLEICKPKEGGIGKQKTRS